MRYIPFRKYEIVIPYNPNEFEEMLVEEILRGRKKKKGLFSSTETLISGYAGNGFFELCRVGYGNTTLIPYIKGRILNSNDNKSSIIELKIMYHALSYVFIIFWFSFITIIFFISLIDTLIYWEFNIGILITSGMFLFGYGIILLTFTEEIKTIKKFFFKKWYIRLD
jgi:hypothetical protein